MVRVSTQVNGIKPLIVAWRSHRLDVVAGAFKRMKTMPVFQESFDIGTLQLCCIIFCNIILSNFFRKMVSSAAAMSFALWRYVIRSNF